MSADRSRPMYPKRHARPVRSVARHRSGRQRGPRLGRGRRIHDAVRHQDVVAGQLQVALNSRVIIEQGKGVLAERLRVTPDEAFAILRRYARDHNHPLTGLAGDVIHGTARITGDG